MHGSAMASARLLLPAGSGRRATQADPNLNPNPNPNRNPNPNQVAGIARLKLIEEQKLLKRLSAGLEREEQRTPRHHDHAVVRRLYDGLPSYHPSTITPW